MKLVIIGTLLIAQALAFKAMMGGDSFTATTALLGWLLVVWGVITDKKI